MIFNWLELSLLTCPPWLRWLLTFSLTMIIISYWYVYLYRPAQVSLRQLTAQVIQFHNSTDDKQFLADVKERFTSAASLNDMFNDLTSQGIIVKKSSSKLLNYDKHASRTSVTLCMQGRFEDFYYAMQLYAHRYRALIQACDIVRNDQGQLVIDAEIIIYS